MHLASEPVRAAISAIIPTLNERNAVEATLQVLVGMPGLLEVIVADGGSEDGTGELARRHGAAVIVADRGRGRQMNAGARAARGDVLWFLHADTLPPPDASQCIIDALDDSRVLGGGFRVRFSGASSAALFFTRAYPFMRRLGLLYGDAAIFVRRSAYDRIGGFHPYPVFEDLDFVRRVTRRGRLVCLPSTVVTSSRRFEGRSAIVVLGQWMALHLLYWLGVSPDTLGRLYAPVRRSSRPGSGRGLSGSGR
jgi:rSAM/selenodomain-associated transferase 2